MKTNKIERFNVDIRRGRHDSFLPKGAKKYKPMKALYRVQLDTGLFILVSESELWRYQDSKKNT